MRLLSRNTLLLMASGVVVLVSVVLLFSTLLSRCSDGFRGGSPASSQSCTCHGWQMVIRDRRAVDAGRDTLCLGFSS